MRFSFVLSCLCLCVPGYSIAKPVFFQHRVADPLNLLSAIPAYSSPSTGAFEVQVGSSYVNVFSGGVSVSDTRAERLQLDGEIGQVELRGQFSLGSCYSAGFDSRFISHSGGTFDSAIEAWHDFFQLPNGMRELSPQNELNYFYSANGNVNPSVGEFSNQQTQIQTSRQALGDVWLTVQRPIVCSAISPVRNSVASSFVESMLGHVRMGVKLPLDGITNGVNAWASGGQTAVFADWHGRPLAIGEKARFSATAGMSYSGEWASRFAALSTRRVLGYGAFVMDYRWNARWQSVLQLDVRSPAFESELTELGNWGAQLHVGARVALSSRHNIEFSFNEDVAVDTAPDIGLRIAFSYTP